VKLGYTVAVDDHHGGISTQAVTIVINGTDDASVITSGGGGATAHYIIEDVDGDKGPTEVTTIKAADVDQGDTVTYSIVGGANAKLFAINPATGVLTLTDHDGGDDHKAPLEVKVAASDGHLSKVQTLLVQLSDGDHMVGDAAHGQAETFVFAPQFEHATVANFDPASANHDVLQFDHTIFTDAQAVLAASRQVGPDVQISHDAGHADHETIVLQNVNLSLLHANDMVFV